MIRFWNFAGMTSSLRFFHEFDPMGEFHGAYTFNEICFNPDGDLFVLCRAHPQPLLFSREGVSCTRRAALYQRRRNWTPTPTRPSFLPRGVVGEVSPSN